MKKLLFLLCIFVHHAVFAMDSVFDDTSIELLPLQPNVSVCNDYSLSPLAKQYLIAVIKQLPEELQKKIIAKRYGLRESKILTIPVKHIVEAFCEQQKYCPLQIGNKSFFAAQLLEMSPEKRKRLIDIAHPSLVKKIGGSSSNMLTKDDRDELICILAEDGLQEGLIIRTLSSSEDIYVGKCGIYAEGCKFAIAPLMGGSISLLLLLGLCFSSLDISGSVGISAGVFSVITLGGTIGTYYQHRNLLINNAQQLQLGRGT